MHDIEAICQENRELKIKIAAYEKILNQDLEAPPQFRLNATETKIYNALLVAKFVDAIPLLDLHLSGTSSKDPIPMIRAVISMMRVKLREYGVNIYHLRHHGYFFTEAGKAICREQMEIAQQKFQSTNSSIANPN